jgi:hypothetical protein
MRYHQLAYQMCNEVDCLWVKYEAFHDDFSGVVEKVAEHLHVELHDVDYANCSQLFRPRPESRWLDTLISGRSVLRNGARILRRGLLGGGRRKAAD